MSQQHCHTSECYIIHIILYTDCIFSVQFILTDEISQNTTDLWSPEHRRNRGLKGRNCKHYCEQVIFLNDCQASWICILRNNLGCPMQRLDHQNLFINVHMFSVIVTLRRIYHYFKIFWFCFKKP